MISKLTSHYLKLQYFAFIEHIVVSVQCPKLRHLRSVVRKISLKEHLSTLKVSDDLTAVHQWGGAMSTLSTWSLALLILCFCPEPGVLCCGMDQNLAIRGPKLWRDGHCNSCNKRRMAAVNTQNEYKTSRPYYKVKLSELWSSGKGKGIGST